MDNKNFFEFTVSLIIIVLWLSIVYTMVSSPNNQKDDSLQDFTTDPLQKFETPQKNETQIVKAIVIAPVT